MTEKIPGPPKLPIIGNLIPALGQEYPFQALHGWAKQYGEIVDTQIIGQHFIWVFSWSLLNELCDEKRFSKGIHPYLSELRVTVHDGLFTAYDHERNWGIAHRTLVPAFGPLSVTGMLGQMKDIASQLVLKWLRYGPTHEIDITEDFTRLTLDTIALCAMDYRFNSFYTDELHPFVAAMGRTLAYTDLRQFVAPFLRAIVLRSKERQHKEDIKTMRDLAMTLIRERKERPNDTNDLLNVMLTGKDPKTGESLDQESIIDNLITFLIAGHETTSGMLSFTLYYLIKNQEAYKNLRQEIDSVVGNEEVQLEHLSKLPYLNAVLRESSRLMPTAPGMGFTPKSEQGEIVGGKYHIAKGQTLVALLHNCHRDKEAYGDDAEEFKPERMLDENFEKLPPNAWKTFGNGKRGCIGKGFAWQEMLLVMVMLFQQFDFEFTDPNYELAIQFMLTIKPEGMRIKAIPRSQTIALGTVASKPITTTTEVQSDGKPMTVLYGSNSGTCETLARTLQADAAEHGYAATVSTLDAVGEKLPQDQPVIIVTASYEGQPTDNAVKFYKWLESGPKLSTKFAVFGCGHADWKHSFHRVPKAIDNMLGTSGAQRICQLGLADASKGNMMSEFQDWEDSILWPELDSEPRMKLPTVQVEMSSQRATQRSDVSTAKVLESKLLTASGEPEKKHIILQLAPGSTFKAGDYCAILPFNPQKTVHRVMTRFGLSFDTVLKVKSNNLPSAPLSALDLFGSYLELSQPATRRDVAMLVNASGDETLKQIYEDFDASVSQKHVSLLDLLERYPKIELPLSSFIASLIPMRVRQYSIASSPLAHSDQVTLTYDILDYSSTGRHIGVASNYLSTLQPGDVIHASVRTSKLRLPEPNTPVIMIAAGSGIAPFRGFIQERAALIGSGRTLAPAHFFFGCRGSQRDDLYRSDLDFWEKLGAVKVYRAYSREEGKHVDQLLLEQRELLSQLWSQNAKVYVCGSRRMGDGVKQAFFEIARDMVAEKGEDDGEEGMQRWFEGVVNQRYVTDVFD